ncbi:MAG: glutamate-1-semialdehyde 2,1-aminomutase [Candidatus Omnitrophica bacterium]|nr:glutamate-1-semialdehyde 2,1-aminomutase [Candidatus Omnitrophota bacterium]
MEKREKSQQLYKQAQEIMPAGVNSPVRAFGAVGGDPIFIKKGKGSRIYDVDGNSYIDYVLSWGPLILGHAEKQVIAYIKQALSKGTSFGAPTEAETNIAQMIKRAFPSMEKMRLVNSGTEATMSAIRLARGFTKKDKIIKFEGCYHGHTDSLLVKAGSGAATFGIPTSTGIPYELTKNTIVLPYNDIDQVRAIIRSSHKQIAAVILEPVCGNMGVVVPKDNFLADLRQLTREYDILLIFDEVMTGFRFCFGGAQTIFKINPDITCLGKIIGGGLPIGAYGASQEIMDCVSPLGGMYQAGTLSGNPIAVACGLKTLQILQIVDYKKIITMTEALCTAIEAIARENKLDLTVNYLGSMFTLFFTNKKVFNYQDACSCNTKNYAAYFTRMLESGVYCAPSQFEANFLSFAHGKKDIEDTIQAAKNALTSKDD